MASRKALRALQTDLLPLLGIDDKDVLRALRQAKVGDCLKIVLDGFLTGTVEGQ